jgi:GNAT superfamily N-acetyltransferase
MRIRAATVDDAAQIAGVHVAAWQAAYRGLIPDAIRDGLSIKDRAERWREILKPSAGITFIGGTGKVVTGFCNLIPSRDNEPGSKAVGEIAAIYVHPVHWRAGTGRKLCERALREAQKWQCKSVTLWTLSTNTPAIRFYEAMGFVPDGATKMEWLKDFKIHEIRLRIHV